MHQQSLCSDIHGPQQASAMSADGTSAVGVTSYRWIQCFSGCSQIRKHPLLMVC
ncbi:MAG TPA: hypothetical protein VHO70_10800 [Chitinispirillaceae bacterium]|nr:hypothetical protein [Chitinispirillaceae bacterium]